LIPVKVARIARDILPAHGLLSRCAADKPETNISEECHVQAHPAAD
jgi:hypothetical protein